MLQKITCTLITFTLSLSGFSQLNITQNSVANQLAQQLIGAGVTISNATINLNNANQAGIFSNGGSTNLGLNSGIVLSNGNVTQIPGSANGTVLSSDYTSTGCGFLGLFTCPSTAPDLKQVSGEDVYDAVILEFDFVPTGTQVAFDFIFSSDEYTTYVNSSFNDAFGIFLSGPGINGSFSNNSVNMALVPNSTTPITINNINNGYSGSCNPSGPCTNCQYYIDNCSGSTIGFNGFTTVIKATYNVQCGQTYHIKFAIGDASDGTLDSGIFIGGNSFTANGVNIDAEISGQSIPEPYSVCDGSPITLGTTNTGGTFLWQPGGQTTPSITVSPTQTTTYILEYSQGGCTATDTAVVTVTPPPTVNTQLTPAACGQSDGEVIVNASGGVAPYSFEIDISGQTTQNTTGTFSGLVAGTYTITVTDNGGCETVLTRNIGSVGGPTIDDLVVIDPSCTNDDAQITVQASGGNPPYAYQWFDENNNPIGTNSDNIGPIPPGEYTVEVKDGMGCITTESVEIDSSSTDAENATFSLEDFCVDSPSEAVITGETGGTFSIVSPKNDGAAISPQTGAIQNAQSGTTYTVEYTTTGACAGTYTQNVTALPTPTANFIADPETATSANPTIYFKNESENAKTYSWDFDDFSPISHKVNPTHDFPEDSSGYYSVTLIASNGTECADTITKLIHIEDDLIFYVPNTFTPDGDTYNEVFKPIFTAGFDPQTYSFIVYNKWGEVLFESHNVDVGWNGSYGIDSQDVVQDGIYIWKIKIKETGKDKHNYYTGHITVIR